MWDDSCNLERNGNINIPWLIRRKCRIPKMFMLATFFNPVELEFLDNEYQKFLSIQVFHFGKDKKCLKWTWINHFDMLSSNFKSEHEIRLKLRRMTIFFKINLFWRSAPTISLHQKKLSIYSTPLELLDRNSEER